MCTVWRSRICALPTAKSQTTRRLSTCNEIKIVAYDEAYPLIEKMLLDVPGFIKDTKVLPKKTAGKVFKIMKKTKFSIINHTFAKENVKRLLD